LISLFIWTQGWGRSSVRPDGTEGQAG